MFLKRVICVVLVSLCFSAAASAQTKAWGWRGDGTGKFPDANPPVTWERISKTMKGLHAQAEKPKGPGVGNAAPVKHGTLGEWLVLEPISAPGKIKNLIDLEQIPGEAKLEGDLAKKVNGLAWRKVHTEGSILNFNHIFEDLQDKVVYAHAYIHSANDATVWLRLNRLSSTIWVNGEEVFKGIQGFRNPYLLVKLSKGWNRLLVKTFASKQKARFSNSVGVGVAYFQLVMYGTNPDEKCETQNILWTAPLPEAGWFSAYQPVIVGNRVYVTSSPAFLICYDKMTGKRLWVRYNGFCEFVTPEERQKFPEVFEQFDPKAKRFKELAQLYKGTKGERAELGVLYRDLIGLLKKIDPEKYDYVRNQEPGLASQPVTDGKSIYTWSHHGIAACYDLDGNQKWRALVNEGRHWKHGWRQAPLLVGEEMVVSMKSIIGFDRKTGKVNWKIPHRWKVYFPVNRTETSDETDLINYEGLGVYKPGLGFFPWLTSTLDGNTLYRWGGDALFARGPLPKKLTAATKIRDWKKTRCTPQYYAGSRQTALGVNWGVRMRVASVLVHEGLIYTVTTGGILRVLDAETMKLVYAQYLDLSTIAQGYPYPHSSGVCASPTLGGKYIYIWGNGGLAVVIKPGRTFQRVATNRIERLLWGKLGGIHPRSWLEGQYVACTVSSPVFNGNRIYYRSEGHLYCMGEKK